MQPSNDPQSSNHIKKGEPVLPVGPLELFDNIIKDLKLYNSIPCVSEDKVVLVRLFEAIQNFNKCRSDEPVDSYSQQSVRRLLASPIDHNVNLLMPDTGKFLQSTIEASARFNTELPNGNREYQGGWHYQSMHGTCAAWAMTHGLLCRGHQIDPTLLTSLLNAAVDRNGLNIPTIELAIELVPSSNLELTPTKAHLISTRDKQVELGLAAYFDPTIFKNNLFAEALGKLSGNEDIITSLLKLKFEQDLSATKEDIAVKHNAAVIKDLLDCGDPIYVSVSASYLMSGNQSNKIDSHAVVISGYKVEDGKMDLQIIDSSNGIYWVSLEHLSASLNHFPVSQVIDVRVPQDLELMRNRFIENYLSQIEIGLDDPNQFLMELEPKNFEFKEETFTDRFLRR